MGIASTLTNNFIILAYILQQAAVIIGVFLTIGGIFQFKKYGEQRTMMSTQMSAAGPTLMVVCGATLMILPSFIGTSVMAFFGQGSPLSYEGGPSGYNALIPPILIFVRVVGVLSFIRGIVMLPRSTGQHAQPGVLGKAVTHIIAGVLCVHILGTIELLENIFGLS